MRSVDTLLVACCVCASLLVMSACQGEAPEEDSNVVATAETHWYLATEEHEHAAHWGYEGEIGPEHWGDLAPEYALAKTGRKQSPIDIVTENCIRTELPLLMTFYKDEEATFVNNGHTLQHNEGPSNTLIYDGITYRLAQFHLHTPSEHTIDGKHAEMEIHMVHTSEEGRLLVIGVMVNSGSGNEKSTRLAAALPSEANMEGHSTITVNPSLFIPDKRHYFRYDGSLTTPPCTEGVSWIVMEQAILLPAEIIERVAEIEGKNNRPVQRLNGRKVRRSLP